MTIEQTERPCSDCEEPLQVIYVTELKQVVSGWACPACGYLASETGGFEGSVPKPEKEEYILRIEKPLSSEDVRDPLADVGDEFRARASAEMGDDEVWLLIDPENGELVDVQVGDAVDESDS